MEELLNVLIRNFHFLNFYLWTQVYIYMLEINCNQTHKNTDWFTHRQTYEHKGEKSKKQHHFHWWSLRYKISVLSTTYYLYIPLLYYLYYYCICHPKGLIIVSLYKIKQIIIIKSSKKIPTKITFIWQCPFFLAI